MSAKTTSKSGTTLFAGDAPEVASLDADALAALFDTHDEAWALRTDTDGAEGEPGAPIVAGRLYNDTDATDEARSKGFGFVTYEDRDDAASPFFENGGAHLYVTPGSAGDSPLWQGEESFISDVEVSINMSGDAVAEVNGDFGGSITFNGVSADQAGEDDFLFI